MVIVDSSDEDQEEVSAYDCGDEDEEDNSSAQIPTKNDYVIEHELIDNVSRDEDEDDDVEDYSQYFYHEFDAINNNNNNNSDKPNSKSVTNQIINVVGSASENVVIQKTNVLTKPTVNYEYYDYEKANGASYFTGYTSSTPAPNGVSTNVLLTDRAQTPAFFQTNYYARSSTRSKLNTPVIGTNLVNNSANIQHSSTTTPTPTAMLNNGRYPYVNNTSSNANGGGNGATNAGYYSRAHQHSYFSRRTGASGNGASGGGGFYSSWYGSVPSLDMMCASTMGAQPQQRHEQHRQSTFYN